MPPMIILLSSDQKVILIVAFWLFSLGDSQLDLELLGNSGVTCVNKVMRRSWRKHLVYSRN